ncbi:MAG TPA: tetratricopeptide repeat protein [Acidobacteriaceae bacterium]|nr:tetratricopeptide repeat protein [Acidobacteriaceae bacterium]
MRRSIRFASRALARYVMCNVSLPLCFVALLLSALPGWTAAQESSSLGAITGHVIDAEGKPVPEAVVLLSGAASQRAASDSSGAFQFRALPPGHYRLSINTSAVHPVSDSVELAPGTIVRVELRLNEKPVEASAPPSQAMQFADEPRFTIAGITDWTAAGGHGSDTSLRTSEELTRDTLDLQPDDRPNLCSEDEAALRAAAVHQPRSFKANHCLGILSLRTLHYADAVTYLSAAYHLQPSDAVNEYALAKAYEHAGDAPRAREHLRNLSSDTNRGDLHRLAGLVDESLGDPVAAVHEFAMATHENPSEQNYFAWGSELLYHRAVWQARDVFEEGARAWPKSARILTALGASLFAGALYDDAANHLCQAADLEPNRPEPYLFMGRMEVVAPHPLPCVAEKLAEFHQRSPGNALGDYYLAMSLWKQQTSPADASMRQQVAGLLHEAVAADPHCGEAWLELGNLQVQSGGYASAIPLYSKAVDASPQLTDAWYRLGVAYDRTGQRDKASEAFAQHDSIEKQQAAEVEKERRAIKQFVISSSGTNPPGDSPND